MKLSPSTQQSLLTLVKKSINAKAEQIKEINNTVNFFFDKSDKAEPGTWQAFSMLNQARTAQRVAKDEAKKLAALSKELKNSLRKPIPTETYLKKRELSKQWLIDNKQ